MNLPFNTQQKVGRNVINIYDVEDEYRPDDGIFSDDDITIHRLKHIIYDDLNETERRILLAYVELGSIQKCARLFKVSPSTIWNRIRDIKSKINNKLDILNKDNNTND